MWKNLYCNVHFRSQDYTAGGGEMVEEEEEEEEEVNDGRRSERHEGRMMTFIHAVLSLSVCAFLHGLLWKLEH